MGSADHRAVVTRHFSVTHEQSPSRHEKYSLVYLCCVCCFLISPPLPRVVDRARNRNKYILALQARCVKNKEFASFEWGILPFLY